MPAHHGWTKGCPVSKTAARITENIELRLGWNFEVGGGSSISGADAVGEDEATPGNVAETRMIYGLKATITKQEGWRPQSAVIVQSATPTSDSPARQWPNLSTA